MFEKLRSLQYSVWPSAEIEGVTELVSVFASTVMSAPALKLALASVRVATKLPKLGAWVVPVSRKIYNVRPSEPDEILHSSPTELMADVETELGAPNAVAVEARCADRIVLR